MRKFLIRGSLFFLLVFLIDRSIGALISHGVASMQIDRRVERIVKGELDASIIILGSSRGARNIIASRLGAELGETAYNLGYPGSNIDFHDTLLELLIRSGSTPNMVILALDDSGELRNWQTLSFRLDKLYPYVSHVLVGRIVCARSNKSLVASWISRAYRERANLKDALGYALSGAPQPDSLSALYDDGSMPTDGRSVTFEAMTFTDSAHVYDPGKESGELRDKFVHLVNMCEEHGIRLVILFPPIFYTETAGFRERIEGLAGPGVVYRDYSSEYAEKDLFYDANHLNLRGAELFSEKLGRDLAALVDLR